MLLFNEEMKQQEISVSRFQYIVCYCSTNLMDILNTTYLNFNTSYVTVQLEKYLSGDAIINNFNTSYVTVQLCYVKHVCIPTHNFNTSYVTVQPMEKGHLKNRKFPSAPNFQVITHFFPSVFSF